MKASRIMQAAFAIYGVGMLPANYIATAYAHDISVTNFNETNDVIRSNSPVVTLLWGLPQFADLNGSAHSPNGFTAADNSSPNFARVDGQAQLWFSDVKAGEYHYLPLDPLGRTTGAYARITHHDREMASHDSHPNYEQNRREDPSGWGHNAKVDVTMPSGKHYRGYFWNRSHLIADSLGGATVIENWVTGTRAQNVGENNGKGGMAYTETIARDYLDKCKTDDCNIYYSAQPVYHDKELIPRYVVVDMLSNDQSINMRVTVENVMPGYTINYTTGEFKKV